MLLLLWDHHGLGSLCSVGRLAPLYQWYQIKLSSDEPQLTASMTLNGVVAQHKVGLVDQADDAIDIVLESMGSCCRLGCSWRRQTGEPPAPCFGR